MSNVKQQVSIQAFVRRKVMTLLGITEVQYGDYVMQQGTAYLDEQLGGGMLNKKLSENALFWAWWRNHWHDADMEFLDSVKFMNRDEMREYYEILHDHKAFEYKPQKAVLQDAINRINNPQTIKHQL